MESIPEKEKKNMIHYQKINIFGESGVGKTSLILHMKNYDDDNFKIDNILDKSIKSIDSNNISTSLVEKIEKVKFNINEDRTLYFNIYETNLHRYDFIKMNLETLLYQNECIILIWNNEETFENIPSFVSIIESGIKQKRFRDVPIFLIKNKLDSNIDNDDESIKSNDNENMDLTIKKLKEENKNIFYIEISLLEKKDFSQLMLEIDTQLFKSQDKNNDDVINLVLISEENKKKEKEKLKTIYISLLGDSNTGKSSFLKALKDKSIDKMTSTTSIDTTVEIVYIHNEKFIIQIMDTAGQERFHSLATTWYKKSHGFLLFFDVVNKSTFESLNNYIEKIKEINDSNEIILLGNKIDENDKREISKKEAKEFAEEKNIKYIECSCKNKINIREVFNEIIFMSYEKFKEKGDNNESGSENLNLSNLDGNNEKNEENDKKSGCPC